MAIDRDVLVEKITGRGEAPAYSWVPPGVDNYEPRRLAFADMSQEERNARARRLVAQAGYGPDNPLQIDHAVSGPSSCELGVPAPRPEPGMIHGTGPDHIQVDVAHAIPQVLI